MLHRDRLWRLVGKAMALLLALVAIAMLAGYGLLSLLLDRPVVSNPVEGIPPSNKPLINLAPYSGAHPRLLDRVEDPYEYPIPVGEIGPHDHLYAGPPQYPFYCRTEDSHLGQPVVDNQHRIGIPVYKEVNGRKTAQVVGYSKDCLIPTQVTYYYLPEGSDGFKPFTGMRADIANASVNGRKVPFIVRVETGSINRFIYAIAALAPAEEFMAGVVERPDHELWNRRLIYQFRGGVGIGKVQGRLSVEGLLKRRKAQLRGGYAIAYSTANQTSNHYNIWLAEETAARVKRQFIARYGEPEYTVGIGGSGGAIQQYLIAQNLPGLLDAAIPLYSYPDMISQTNYVFDCELLEYYFDVLASNNPAWRDWAMRQRIAGMNSAETEFTMRDVLYDLALLIRQKSPHLASGSNECVKAWRGLTSLVNNPRYLYHAGRYSRGVLEKQHWTYWDDMKYVLGTDQYGFAHQTWDNVGVQYGLEALKVGDINAKEFLHLNANIGSWKPPQQMAPERYWKLGGIGGMAGLINFSPWGQHNMRLSPDKGQTPAPRSEAYLPAIQAAYRSGQVFVGYADIPIIDLRHYLDDELDMHHSFASLSTRLRLLEGQGDASNQLIWMTRRPHEPVVEAFDLIDRWLMNIGKYPDRSVAENRPADAQDRCFDSKGAVIADGVSVWDGDWNGKPAGVCTQHYPFYRESRMVAGAPVTGSVFKCHLQTIENALDRGVYGRVDMRPYRQDLKRIFPQGVCNYEHGDIGRPAGLMRDKSVTRPLGREEHKRG
ncbi:DUF6351 family protein [Pontibacterium granulatum]|uniref:DUF6351 family protein n=1 Tax=Pontibacterium granulatum TaxID=2036029 RepID=UPI002499F5D5|nr:DUF6351 family protein [Pontibacterium granulatum]MDI3324962.1 DUF6351 family protein [Pontibacterium granulatum]